MKFGLALEAMNTGKKMRLPGGNGEYSLGRDERGIPVKILCDGKPAKLTHEELLSQNWEVA